jgi:transcriptional regulator with XRE-family HTH domain
VFGAELRFYRTRAGLSQKDLAARATVSHDVISKIETGALIQDRRGDEPIAGVAPVPAPSAARKPWAARPEHPS